MDLGNVIGAVGESGGDYKLVKNQLSVLQTRARGLIDKATLASQAILQLEQDLLKQQ